MNNKGFTLSELLVTLAIFAIVLVIGIPSIINAVNRNAEKQYDVFVKEIISSAEDYIEENRNLYTPLMCSPNCVISMDTLIMNGNLDKDLYNPKTHDKLDGMAYVVVVTFDEGKMNLEFRENYNEA